MHKEQRLSVRAEQTAENSKRGEEKEKTKKKTGGKKKRKLLD